MSKHTVRTVFDLVLLLAGLSIGYVIASWPGVLSVTILAVLEISLSFDNAVVNATVLKNMSKQWQEVFLTVGLLIAVVGMRLVLPILIVSGTSWLNPMEVVKIAFNQPQVYAQHLQAAHVQIAGFGGGFLFTLFFGYFLDKEKDVHWLKWLEAPMAWFGKFEGIPAMAALLVSVLFSFTLQSHDSLIFLISATMGILIHAMVEWIGQLLGSEDAATGVAKAGLAGFLYLELVDASMSFDGVVGAFAISNEIAIIMAGLGIGAMAVRSLTIYMVEKGTLDALPFLEHSAFWAIGVLASLVYVSTFKDVPEVISGLAGAGFIAAGVVYSLYRKKVDAVTVANQVIATAKQG